jgi:hypothetical protein
MRINAVNSVSGLEIILQVFPEIIVRVYFGKLVFIHLQLLDLTGMLLIV